MHADAIDRWDRRREAAEPDPQPLRPTGKPRIRWESRHAGPERERVARMLGLGPWPSDAELDRLDDRLAAIHAGA